jgi:hypothetical protein
MSQQFSEIAKCFSNGFTVSSFRALLEAFHAHIQVINWGPTQNRRGGLMFTPLMVALGAEIFRPIMPIPLAALSALIWRIFGASHPLMSAQFAAPRFTWINHCYSVTR